MWKKRIAVGTVIAVFLLMSILGWLSSHPILSCNIDIPKDYLQAIEGEAKGLYSKQIPLVPVYIHVDNYIENRVYYIIYYFPAGTVGMSYQDEDGYCIETGYNTPYRNIQTKKETK